MIFAVTPDVNVIALPESIFDSINSPTLPAAALSLVVVPTTPVVEVNVILVALAAPKTGVTNVGEVAKTKEPLPVSFVTAVAKFALVGVAKNVAIPDANPEIPELTGRFVAFVNTAELGVPKAGEVSDGEFAKTKAPDPVSSVIAEAKFALEGVAKKVATPVPSPLTPLEMGKFVPLDKTIAVGVPSAGLISVGLVDPTNDPVPVDPLNPLLTALIVVI